MATIRTLPKEYGSTDPDRNRLREKSIKHLPPAGESEDDLLGPSDPDHFSHYERTEEGYDPDRPKSPAKKQGKDTLE